LIVAIVQTLRTVVCVGGMQADLIRHVNAFKCGT